MMKKIIALALALSMALSMVAFAGYTDAAEINADLSGDIELVTALGIMTGNPDGSFNPKGTLTRAEAAVVIYRLKANRSDIDASWGDASLNTFTDMADHWSAKWVNYCAALGLITGYPDGTYRPEAPVTAVEMAKMLLNVAGYDTEKQGYGKNWPAAVLADATNSGLFADYEAAYTAAASREWVAKMVANLLDVQTVGYSQLTGTLVGNFAANGTTPIKFGAQYGYEKKTGTVVASAKEALGGNTAAGTGKSKVQIGTSVYTLKTALTADMIGSKVTVYFNGTPSTSDDNKVYAVIETNKKVIETTIDAISVKVDADDSTKTIVTVGDEVVFHDTTNKLTVSQYKNLAAVSGADAWNFASTNKDFRPATVIVNGDSTATTVDVFFNVVRYTTVTSYDAEGYSLVTGALSFSGKDQFEDLTVVGELKADDKVCIETNGRLDVTHTATKMNPVRTKLTSVVGTGADTVVTVGSTTYAPRTGVSLASLANLTKTNLKNNVYDLYTDGKYVVSYELYRGDDPTGLTSNLAYVIDFNSTDGSTFAESQKVQVMFSDGTIVIYEYSAPSSGTKVAFSELARYTVYEYVLNDDGTLYCKPLAAAGDGRLAATGTVTMATTAGKSYVVVTDNNNTVATTDDVPNVKAFMSEDTFFFYSLQKGTGATATTKYGVVKASELPKSSGTGAADYSKYAFSGFGFAKDTETNLYSLTFGVLASNADVDGELPVAGPSGSNLFIVSEVASKVTTTAGTTYDVTGINMSGEVETLTLRSDMVGGTGTTAIQAGKIYVIKTDADGKYLANTTSDDVANDNTAADKKWTKTQISASTNDVVMINGTLYDVADNAVITYVYTNSDNEIVLKTAGLPSVIPHEAANVYVKFTGSSTKTVTGIIIAVTSGTSNTLVNVDGILTFAQ